MRDDCVYINTANGDIAIDKGVSMATINRNKRDTGQDSGKKPV